MAGTNVTLRRRQLANRLREMRHGSGMTVEQVAERLLCSPAKISRIETAQRGVSQRDVRDLCGIYGVTDESVLNQLMTWAREAREPGLRQQWGDLGDDAIYTYADLESAAVAITEFQTAYVPGLLQTEDYARALIAGMLPRIGDDYRERRVEARMQRQRLLHRSDPPRYWTFVDEAVLHRQIGGTKVLREQLAKVVELAHLPHVTVQVIPYSAGAYMGADSPFVLFEIGDRTVPLVVHLELLTRSEYLEKPDEVAGYREAIDHLRATALSPQESMNRIIAAAEVLAL
ncbi:helix-turn-helix transcriptional regulator [Microbispora corallina]|uniref:Transcriptional regulator n=1 Tax=Microbispora corallina TaxID=83302 RepID=A0ABQ4FXN3_9ACTN|nr:helix-turn-helix transcriptional regulator [Microbispora corallina]GIH39586.1 transcriptional regulator [Microbispora corallina]